MRPARRARHSGGGSCSLFGGMRERSFTINGVDRTIFEPEHDALREAWGSYLDREVAPVYDQWERERRIPREVLRRVGELGFLGPAIPERFGGAGSDDFRFNAVLT